MKNGSPLQIVKSNQEQAVASWINYLNQLRLDKLVEELNDIQNTYDLNGAMRIINSTIKQISKEIIERNRGGDFGMHGFIAECGEVGLNNAWQKFEGKLPEYVWLNDNGPADIQKGAVLIQQKFHNAGNNLSLYAVKQHLEAYPDFLRNGGKYQIPKDQFDRIKELLSITEEQANKMPTSDGTFSLKQWKIVHQFFDDGEFKLSDFEEARLDYKSAQKGKVFTRLRSEKAEIKNKYNNLKDKAFEKSQPTIQEGLKATGVSAAIEGGTTLVLSIVRKIKSGKSISDFSTKDWEEVLKDTGLSTVKGGVRGASIYLLTNCTATPAATASSIVTASFSIAAQANRLRKGEISDEEFLLNSQMVCLDASVSALSSFVGQAIIPIPVIGAVIGNTVGTIMYKNAKDYLSKYEQKLMVQYLADIEKLNKKLDKQYQEFVTELIDNLQTYYSLLEKAFAPDYQVAFDGSISLALNLGVPVEKILKNTSEIDKYFLM